MESIYLSLFLTAIALATPLLLAALGEIIGERAGVLNIGLEGMMLCGALAGASCSFAASQYFPISKLPQSAELSALQQFTHVFPSAFIGLLCAMLAGMIMAALFAFLAITLRADAVVVGTGVNLCALGITGLAHRSLSGRWDAYKAVELPQWFFLICAAILVPLLWWGFSSTRSGLQLRAVGEYPQAADTAGVQVNRVRWLATLCNGALCGMAGAFLSMSHTDSFGENMTAGRGFIALALVIFGRWNPWGALAGALLFGLAEGSQFFFQSRVGTLFYPLLLALPYFMTLIVLSGFAGKTRAPAALGQPYEK